MRRRLLMAGALACWAATPAGAETFEGEATTAWPNTSALCIELPENRSTHVSQMCFGILGLKWQIGTFAGSPLASVATKWDLQPTVFLRDDDNAGLGRPLGAFAPEVQAAFAEISITGIDLAVNVLPNGGAAAVGFGLLPHEGTLDGAGAPYPGRSPSAHSWDDFFVAMPEGDACAYAKDAGGTPVYLAEDVARTAMKDGFTLANLSACGASFSGLGAFSRALEKSCEAWASDEGRDACKTKGNTVAAAPTSPAPKRKVTNLDRLLSDVDEPAGGTEEVADTDTPQSKKSLEMLLADVDAPTGGTQEKPEAPKPKKSLEMLLSDVEGGYAETVEKQQIAAANVAAAAALKQCQANVREFDRQVSKYVTYVDRYADHAFYEADEAGDCSGLVRDMYHYYDSWSIAPDRVNYTYHGPGYFGDSARFIKACVGTRRSKLRALKNSISSLDFSSCVFDGATPMDQLVALEQSVEEGNLAYLREASAAWDAHQVALAAEARADAQAASLSSVYQYMYNSANSMSSHLQSLNSFDTTAIEAYRATSKNRTVSVSTATSPKTQPSGQTNQPLVINQGTLAGGHCASIADAAQQTRCLNEAHGRAMDEIRARGGSGGGGSTTAKTQ